MKSREQIARTQFEKLDVRDRKRVLDWVELGNSWEDSLLSSGVLTGPRPPIGRFSPSDAARQAEYDRMDEILLESRLRNLLPDETSRRYETAHHEAAHAIVIMALNKSLRSVSISSDDARTGLCSFAKGSTPLEVATVCVAPVIWIEQVFYKQFRHYLPHGATGCESDLRKAREATAWELDKAFKQCRAILRENYDSVVSVANALDRDGEWRPGHTRPKLPA